MLYLRVILFFFVFNTISCLQAQTGNSIDVEFEKICLIDSLTNGEQRQFFRFYAINSEQVFDRTYDLSSSYSPAGTLLPCCCNGGNVTTTNEITPLGYFRDPQSAFEGGVNFEDYFWAAALNDMGMIGGTIIQQIYFQ